ncbi:MAG: type I 3-dehydroquinate dehydratase [Lachnospiraceae bacterium]|nr:type I 3-dehydroquinate dehydratase [Lachnospiraceae bacterium]
MRPKICIPIIAPIRDMIMAEAAKIAGLPVQMAEWRVDFYAGYEREILSVIAELKKRLGGKELIVTLRTENEGGEPNGSRFDYFSLITEVLEQGVADYVDVESERGEEKITRICQEHASRSTKIIGSYHDFHSTPADEFILGKLKKAKNLGCDVGKVACMPAIKEDTYRILSATAEMKKKFPDFPVITMSMGKLGEISRLYGGLYGSEVSFGTAGKESAPGQIAYEKMIAIFDKLYAGKKHIVLIGFMGVGKSTISGALANLSGREELDTDRWITEQEGRSIPEIFETEGEEYFRGLETDMIDELGSLSPSIVSCGGGMALREINVRKLQVIGDVVLLTAEPETIFERVRYSKSRPILNGNMSPEYIHELMEKRRPYYEKAADFAVRTDGRTPEDIAKEILEKCGKI